MQADPAPELSGVDAALSARNEPLRSKLLRYLFPRQLMSEPHGDVFLQHRMLSDNLQVLRRHSAHYVRVHAVLTGLLLAFVAAVATAAPVLAECAGLSLLVPELVCLVVFASIAVAMRLD